MKKRKLLHTASASVMAVSALVVVPSVEASSADEVAQLVAKAKEMGNALKWAISIEGSADGKTRPWTAYNEAKDAYDKALKAVNALPIGQKNIHLAELEELVNLHITRTRYYIDAITAGEKIKEKQEALSKQMHLNLINDDTEKAYHELSSEIRKQAILLDRVYGKSTRDLIRSQYKQSAEKILNDAKYPVTVKMEIDLAREAVMAKNMLKAARHLEAAKTYLKFVESSVMIRNLSYDLQSLEFEFQPATKIKSIEATSENSFTIELSEALKNNELTITKGSTVIKPTYLGDISYGQQTKYEVELPTAIYSSSESSVSLDISVSDPNLAGIGVKSSILLSRDLTPPRFVRAHFENLTNEIHLIFDKPLKASLPNVNHITLYNQEHTPIRAQVKANSSEKMIIDATNLEDGSYIIAVSERAVSDNTLSGNGISAFTTTVTKKTITKNPPVTFIESEENGQFNVISSEAVNYKSATSPENYSIDGQPLPADSVITISSDQKLVSVTLPEGTISVTKPYVISVNGVKSLANSVMNLFSDTVISRDNTQPELAEATLEDEHIRLTFSESINTHDDGKSSFEITVNGIKLSEEQYRVMGTPSE